VARASRRETLCRRWIHSHEEDEGDKLVYRPDDYAFPPARGRRLLELHRDGSAAVGGPGPTDRPEAAVAAWALRGRTLTVEASGAQPPQRVYEIVSSGADKLVLRRVT